MARREKPEPESARMFAYLGFSPPRLKERAMKFVICWSYIMKNAKEQGLLRLAGKFKEADEKEK